MPKSPPSTPFSLPLEVPNWDARPTTAPSPFAVQARKPKRGSPTPVESEESPRETSRAAKALEAALARSDPWKRRSQKPFGDRLTQSLRHAKTAETLDNCNNSAMVRPRSLVTSSPSSVGSLTAANSPIAGSSRRYSNGTHMASPGVSPNITARRGTFSTALSTSSSCPSLEQRTLAASPLARHSGAGGSGRSSKSPLAGSAPHFCLDARAPGHAPLPAVRRSSAAAASGSSRYGSSRSVDGPVERLAFSPADLLAEEAPAADEARTKKSL